MLEKGHGALRAPGKLVRYTNAHERGLYTAAEQEAANVEFS